jgi:hypothetical protein
MKFYRSERIEEIADRRLREFECKLQHPLSLPLDIELFGDLVLGISMLWEDIEELPGEEVLAGLSASDRLIVMNQRHKHEMEQKPGRRRLTQGHEMALGSVRGPIKARSPYPIRFRRRFDLRLSQLKRWAGPSYHKVALE